MTMTIADVNIEPPRLRSGSRRGSEWTAEVLSIGISVDYVIDPADLPSAYLTKPAMASNGDATDHAENHLLTPTDETGKAVGANNKRNAEVGVVLPMVSLHDDKGTPLIKSLDPTTSKSNGHDNGDDDGDDGDDESNSNQDDDPEKQMNGDPDPQDDVMYPREHWENKFQFLLSTIGYAVDLSNVWRFPFLCYKNGGGAFLIPYFTTLIFGAMPVFFMEMCIGQYHRRGPISAWQRMTPMFKGIGMASCFMAYVVAFYYNVIIGWSFFYLFSSFTSTLPWTHCDNDFNSDRCWQIEWDTNTNNTATITSFTNITDGSGVGVGGVIVDSNGTKTITYNLEELSSTPSPLSSSLSPSSHLSHNRTYNISTSVSSTMEFFERGLLQLHKSGGLEDLGSIRWQLALCTLLTFTAIYFCLWKGVKSTGKVVYVTATLPYLIMSILLVRGAMLPGAEAGIKYFITPKFQNLNNPKVWIDAAVQIFFSVGSGFGTHIAYASYNKFDNDCKRDCIITVIVNSFTSVFSGFVIFSYLGYMSLKTHKDIDKVATEGPGLVFIVYPEAIATLPGSVWWSIIFFFMLLALGLDSAFGGLESALTGLKDEFRTLCKYKYFREILTLVIIASAFIFSLPCLTQGGMYVFTILDTFAAGTSIVFIVLCEVVIASWFYGVTQICQDVEKMTKQQPGIFWKVCWKCICPLLLTIIVLSSIIHYQPLQYTTSRGVYTYPYYANILGWCIAASSMIMVPGYALYAILSTPGTFRQRLALCISPHWEHNEIIETKFVKRFQRKHWLSMKAHKRCGHVKPTAV